MFWDYFELSFLCHFLKSFFIISDQPDDMRPCWLSSAGPWKAPWDGPLPPPSWWLYYFVYVRLLPRKWFRNTISTEYQRGCLYLVLHSAELCSSFYKWDEWRCPARSGKTSINSSSPFALCIKSWLFPILMHPSSYQSLILELTSLVFLDLGSWLSAWRESCLWGRHKRYFRVTTFHMEFPS